MHRVFRVYVMAVCLVFFVRILTVGVVVHLIILPAIGTHTPIRMPCPVSIWEDFSLVLLYLVLSCLATVSWRTIIFWREARDLGERSSLRKVRELEGKETDQKRKLKKSKSLVIKEMKIKRTLRFYLAQARMASQVIQVTAHAGQAVEKWGHFSIVGVIVTTTLEINQEFHQKIGNCFTWRHSYIIPMHIPKRCSIIPEGHMLLYVHNSQKL